ncbi:unnamed protein product [Ilex paraguariensis]
MQSSVSVAKYCVKHLSKNFSVVAVDNGKIVFQREATTSIVPDSQVFVVEDDDWKKNRVPSSHGLLSKIPKSNRRKILKKISLCSAPKTVLPEDSCNPKSLSRCGIENNSMALVPIKSQQLSKSKRGWELLRRFFLKTQKTSKQTSVKKIPLMQLVLKLPSRQSLVAVYPDQKQSIPEKNRCHSSSMDGEKEVIVQSGSDATSLPSYPAYCLNSVPEELEGFCELYSSIFRLFSYQELLLATSNFMPDNMIGKGGSSQVYRGCFPDGKEVAVKILKPSEDVLKQFFSEIEILTALQHKNVISLFGFCFEDNNLLLVYDFLSRGSLEENLHGNQENGNIFGWEHRYKVALGVAEALDYLHNGAPQPILHRDVKSSNILLLDDFEPLLSDFGLAMPASSSSCHVDCTDVAGTFGYLAPEYFMHGKMNEKIDVYAFGVVLLELLSGRKPIDNGNPKGQECLVMWAEPILKGKKVSQLLDPSFGGDYDHDQLEKMVLAASLCIKRAPQLRPQISLVLKLLLGETEITTWARQHVDVSHDVDAEQSPTNMQSFINLALLNVEDDSLSVSSTEQSISLEDYLKGRWSRSSSFA